MKRILFSGMVALLLLCSTGAAIAQENPLKQLTGAVWMSSTEESKKALIYGVECAVSMEYSVAEHMAQKDGKASDKDSVVNSLSLFAKNWIRAFEHTNRSEIVNELDAWFASHSDAQDEYVFRVLWKEIMQPKLDAR